MPLKQGQKVLLGQAERLRQPVALAGKDRYALGPGFAQTGGIGPRNIGRDLLPVVLDDTHLDAPCPEQRDGLFQKGRLSAVFCAADRQHRRMFQTELCGQSLFAFCIQ